MHLFSENRLVVAIGEESKEMGKIGEGGKKITENV